MLLKKPARLRAQLPERLSRKRKSPRPHNHRGSHYITEHIGPFLLPSSDPRRNHAPKLHLHGLPGIDALVRNPNIPVTFQIVQRDHCSIGGALQKWAELSQINKAHKKIHLLELSYTGKYGHRTLLQFRVVLSTTLMFVKRMKDSPAHSSRSCVTFRSLATSFSRVRVDSAIARSSYRDSLTLL